MKHFHVGSQLVVGGGSVAQRPVLRSVGHDQLVACQLVGPGAEAPALRDLVAGSVST